MTSASPRVCTVVSCGKTKIDLDAGEAVPARELYSSPVHSCKDRFGRHSDGYYIMSAEYGLVRHDTEISWYDRTLDNMSDVRVRAWGRDVADDLAGVVGRRGFDAVVLLGSETYVGALEPHFDRIPADVLTPWQTCDDVTGVGKAMSWCTDEERWPANVDDVREIAEVVSPADSIRGETA